MPIQRLKTDARMSAAVIHNGTVMLSGEIANDLTGGVFRQTQETLSNIDQLLEVAGTTKDHLLSATIYLKNIQSDFNAMNEAWEQWIPEGRAPARATVEAQMFSPDVLVEISIVAALPS
ncbi:RidA family protein [Pseudomonas sp. NPDC089407]|uniref:RidA family protein n=1 Tax=Pseudomonas sp. NPDC089407 TaxID=3364464 RepID=UPI00384EE9BE